MDWDRLRDGGLVPKANGVDPMSYVEVHSVGLRAGGDVLHETIDFPFGKCVLALQHRFLDVTRLGFLFEVSVGKEPCL